MSLAFEALIDQIVTTAQRNGDLDNLTGQGKPLADLDQPKDMVLDRLLKESQAKPVAVELQLQIAASRKRLAQVQAPDARKAEMAVLADLQMRLSIELEALRKYG